MTAVFLGAVLAAVPGTGDPPPATARLVSIASASHPRRVTLEWRRIENGATVRLSEQSVTLGGRTDIPAAEDERVLRVRETDAAPRSFLIPAGTARVSLDLPPPVRGGELFGRLPARSYPPEAIRLLGASLRVEARTEDDGVFEVSGLAPGRYELEPLYRGGVVGRREPVTIAAGRATELLPLELPDAGAVRMELAASLCGEGELGLRLDGAGRGSHVSAVPPGTCVLELEGLEPGTWRATVTRGGARNEPRAGAEFVVEAGESTAVALLPVVRVTGTVTAGGAPARGQRLLFRKAADRWNAVTDEGGGYEVVLGGPGEYVVSVMAAEDLPSRALTRTFGPGDQQEDVELGPGTIEVGVRFEPGAPLEQAVDLALFEAQGRRLSGRFEAGEGPAIFSGLDYGQYRVTGTTASGLRSRNDARADLSADAPEARVELVMARGRGVLTVVGADGSPLEGARAAVGEVPLPERGPGLFDLAGVPAGERLVAHAPDHVPACRLLVGDDSSPVVALPLADGLFTLRLRADASWRDVLIIGLPGSDCPVALHDLAPQVRAEDHLLTIAIEVPRGSFAVSVGGQVHEANAPGDLDIP